MAWAPEDTKANNRPGMPAFAQAYARWVGYPRLVNRKVTFQVVRDGRLVAARQGFIDVTKSLQSADLN